MSHQIWSCVGCVLDIMNTIPDCVCGWWFKKLLIFDGVWQDKTTLTANELPYVSGLTCGVRDYLFSLFVVYLELWKLCIVFGC